MTEQTGNQTNQTSQWHPGYKELKNFIHNEMELTKEQIQEMVRELVKEIVNTEILKFVETSKADIGKIMKDVIRHEMILAVNDGKYPEAIGSTYFYDKRDPKPFQDYISGVLKQEVINLMKTQFDVGVQITPRVASHD